MVDKLDDARWQALCASQFWQTKTLAEMNAQEWEAVCDGCGKCCLHKLIDDDTDQLYYTDVACRQLNLETVRCRNYTDRHQIVPECLAFTADNIAEMDWLPPSCAYRLLHEGEELDDWHPLVSGDPQSVHRQQRSVLGHCVSEQEVDVDQWEEHLIRWV